MKHKILIITIVLISFLKYESGFSQCTTISLTDTIHACPNAKVGLHATLTVPVGFTVLDTVWSPALGLSDTTSLNPIASLSSNATMYSLNIQTLTASNLVYNGDFSLGNTGFTSSYTLGTGGPWGLVSYEGTYGISTNTTLLHSLFTSFGDHTTGTGNMMIVNGASSPISIWCQTITVTPNTYYDFSAWGTSCNNSTPAILQFSINGTLVGSPLYLSTTAGLWQEFHVVWYSGSNTSISICINDQQTAASGNDFAIDDISFRQICKTTSSVYIDVNSVKDSVTINEPYCKNGLVYLTSHDLPGHTPATSYWWTFSDGGTANGSSIAHIFPGVGNYSYTLTMGGAYGCADTITQSVIVNNFPRSIAVGNDTAICPRGFVKLWVDSGLSYHWSPELSLTHPSDRFPIARPDTTTTYVVTVKVDSICTAKDSMTVTVHPNAQIKASYNGDEVSCKNPSIQISASGGISYRWAPGSLCDDSLSTMPFVSPILNTRFIVYGIDANGCDGKDSVLVQVEDMANVFMPTAFTPNNDGKNDVIHPIKYCNFKLVHFEIFNRWGQRVFFSNSEKEGWDGNFHGVPAPTDTYYYLVEGQSPQGRQLFKKGDFILVR